MLRPPLQGLVLEAYGVGNGPSRNHRLMDALADASESGVMIVDCSQCLQGLVDLNGYAAGAALAKVGVISGYDMTTEAALAKMFYLFSQALPLDEVKALMQTNLRGELTRRV
jgi:L-asparaginase